MARSTSTGLTAAAGYRQFQNSLTQPEFSDRVIRQVYCRSVTMDVTTSDYTEGLVGHGATLGFQVEPAVVLHEYQKNQTLVPQELESEWRWLDVNRAKYFNIKIDRIDRKQMPNFNKLASNFCSNASKRMYIELDSEVLFKMAFEADKQNKGSNAGIDGDTDLGQYGQPIDFNKDNIIDRLACAKVTLEQACRWEDGNMVMVLPTAAEKAFYSSDLGSYHTTGERSIVLNGRINDTYMGFEVIFSNYVPRVWDAAQNRWVYYIVFANKQSTGLVQQIDDCDIIKIEKSFGDYYRGLWVYGHNSLIPEGVGVMYAYFN